jgi:hypothetical protein
MVSGAKFTPPTDARKVDGQQANHQSQGGYHFKIEQGFPSHTSHLLEVGMPRNAHDQGSKQERSNDGFDQMKEDFRKHLQILGDFRKLYANLCPEKHREKDPESERFSPNSQTKKYN